MEEKYEAKHKNLIEPKFVAWETGLSDEERKEIETKLPPQLMVLHRTYGATNVEVRNWYLDYFIQNVNEIDLKQAN